MSPSWPVVGMAFSLLGLMFTLTIQALFLTVRLTAWMLGLMFKLVQVSAQSLSRARI